MGDITNEQITQIWEMLDADDISTECLMQMVCDHFGNRIDHGDVVDALVTLTDREF